MADHKYNPDCGCPGCQFMWAAGESLNKNGPPPLIGTFKPNNGDMALDARFGIYRTWTGEYWHPQYLIGEPKCVCVDGAMHSQFGCFIGDPPNAEGSDAPNRRATLADHLL